MATFDFKDQPPEDDGLTTTRDARESLVYQFKSRLEDLIEDERYSWALDTLESIYKQVEARNDYTDGQHRAVENIERAVEDRQSRRDRFNSTGYRRY